jgi:hypothetical protein
MEDQKVTIEGTEYNVADLSQEQQYMVAQVNDLRGKANNLRFQLDQVVIAEEHFRKLIIESVKPQEFEEVEES